MWLSISLFCHRANWSGLLIKCIYPFLEMLNREKKMQHYHIELNYERGENIRFSVQVSAKDAPDIASYADYYLKAYISKGGSLNDVHEPDGNTIFMDFPQNTVQYGLYSCEPGTLSTYYDPAFQQEISATIFQVAGIAEVNEETIFTLAFHLQLTLLAVTLQHSKLSFDDLMRESNRFSFPRVQPRNLDPVKAHLEKNTARLSEIAYDILNQEGSFPDWLVHWRNICKSKMAEYNRWNAKTTDAIKTYEQLTYLIFRQLGINEYLRSVVFYYIGKSTSVYI